MKIIPLDGETEQARQAINQRVNNLKAQDICPTCENAETGDVYPDIAAQIYYEDDLLSCFLETYPRNLGHSIILLKPHYEDISEMPPDIGAVVFAVIHQAIHALKTHLGAEKVYLCTMCDGERNHLHFQLIPRLPDDAVRGSRVFVKERGLLADFDDDMVALRGFMQG